MRFSRSRRQKTAFSREHHAGCCKLGARVNMQLSTNEASSFLIRPKASYGP